MVQHDEWKFRFVLAAALLHMRHGRQNYTYRRAVGTRDQERDARYLVMVDQRA